MIDSPQADIDSGAVGAQLELHGASPARGFTLIEALVAMAIFAFMGLAAYGILDNIVRVEEQASRKSAEMAGMLKAQWQLGQDFRHMVSRPIINENGEFRNYIEINNDDYLVEFTRRGWPNPLDWPRSQLQRVAYKIDYHPESDDTDSDFFGDTKRYLIRHYWQVIDRGRESRPQEQVVLPDVDDFYLRFYSPRPASSGSNPSSLADEWFETVIDASPGTGLDAFTLPVAVEVNITVAGSDLYSFILPVRSGGN